MPYKEVATIGAAGFGVHWTSTLASTIGLDAVTKLSVRKFIKDIHELYAEFQAGADAETKGPLTDFTFDDAEPSIVANRK